MIKKVFVDIHLNKSEEEKPAGTPQRHCKNPYRCVTVCVYARAAQLSHDSSQILLTETIRKDKWAANSNLLSRQLPAIPLPPA